MPTSEGTKSGSSAASVANSSMITSSRGSGCGPAVGDQAVVLDQVRGPVLAQHPLAVAQLGLEAAQRPLAEVLVEVGDHAHGVGQLGALGERAAALVVDQHEVHARRAGGGGQRGDQAAQQLALARAGGAGDQAVRPVGDQVDVERAVLGQGERGRPAGWSSVLADRQRVAQLGRRRARRAPAARTGRRGRAARRRPAAGRRPRSGPAPARTRARSRGETPATSSGSTRSPTCGRVQPGLAGLVGELDHRRAGRRQPLAGAGQHDPADTARRRAAAPARRPRVPRSAPGCRARPGPTRSSSSSRSVSSAASAAPAAVPTASSRPERPAASRAWGSHLTQSQSSRRRLLGEHRRRQVGRAVQHRRLAEQRAGQGERLVALADDADDAAVGQRHRHRRQLQPAVLGEHHLGVLGGRLAVGQRGPERDLAEAGRQAQEVVVARAGAPTAAGRARWPGGRSRPGRGRPRAGGSAPRPGGRPTSRVNVSSFCAGSRAASPRELRLAWRRCSIQLPITSTGLSSMNSA